MGKQKLTLIVDDSDAESGVEALTTTIANLEYDGYVVVSASKEEVE